VVGYVKAPTALRAPSTQRRQMRSYSKK
jgi:hypothetical protein